jgi:adenylate cyclase
VTLAREVAHPGSLALALYFAAMVHQCRREPSAVRERAEAAIALSAEHGFPFWLAGATILRGWALAEQGEGAEGIALMRQGLDAWQATGGRVMRTYHLALLAEALGGAGRPEEALGLLDEALALARASGERHWEAELHRLSGELLLMRSGGDRAALDEAEGRLRRALDVARRQDAKAWELRAATNLGRLLRGGGEPRQARSLLTEVCRWFTEGSDLVDLVEARALLGALSEPDVDP